MDNRSDFPMFPHSFVGGHMRPRHLFADSFSSPNPTWGEVPENINKAAPGAPVRHYHSYFPDNGPCSEIREEDLAEIRKKFIILPLAEMRCPSEFECIPDGGTNEIAVFEAFLEAGFRALSLL